MGYYEKEIETVVRKLDDSVKVIAIDGRCGSGKTTFASELTEALDAELLHMDDFFLQPYQRTAERYATPGGNVDYERVYEILKQIKEGKEVSFQRFDCTKMELGETLHLSGKKRLVVEGSYSLTPALKEMYDFRIFMHIDPEEQMRRIILRNGAEKALQFKQRWIPLEELYFSHCKVMEDIDILFDTTKGR